MTFLSGDPYHDQYALRAWFILVIIVLDWAARHIYTPLWCWWFVRDIRRHKHRSRW